MHLRLICVGTRMPDWVTTAVGEYLKRLPRECALDLVELPVAPRRGNRNTGQLQEADSRALEKACADGDRRIVLDERGKGWSTRQLSERLAGWRMDGRNVSLLVGGPDGHDERLRSSAEALWSLSPLTLPHGLVRVIVAEQIYRAWSLLQGHPYHRE